MNNLFLRTYKIEVIKLIKRKDTLMLWLMPILSLFYAIALANKSEIVTYTGEVKFTALSYTGDMAMMLSALFIFYIIFAVIGARSLATEIEDRSMLFYIPRIRDRKVLYYAKCLSLLTALVTSFLVFIAVSVGSYFTLLVRRADIASGLWFAKETLAQDCAKIIGVFFSFVFVVFFVLWLSARYKMMFSVCVYLFVSIVLMFAVHFPIIKYASVFTYSTLVGQELLGAWSVMLFSALLCVVYAVVFGVMGQRMFLKRDL